MAKEQRPGKELSSPASELLRGFLDQAGITQTELAKRMSVHPSLVSRWLSGKKSIANYETALGIVEALELPTIPGDLLLMKAGYRPSDDFLNQTGEYAGRKLELSAILELPEMTERGGGLMSKIVSLYKNETIPQEDKEWFTRFLELIVERNEQLA